MTADVLDLGRTYADQNGGALVDWSFTDPAYVYVQWQDGSGTWSPVTSASVLADTTPPQAR